MCMCLFQAKLHDATLRVVDRKAPLLPHRCAPHAQASRHRPGSLPVGPHGISGCLRFMMVAEAGFVNCLQGAIWLMVSTSYHASCLQVLWLRALTSSGCQPVHTLALSRARDRRSLTLVEPAPDQSVS